MTGDNSPNTEEFTGLVIISTPVTGKDVDDAKEKLRHHAYQNFEQDAANKKYSLEEVALMVEEDVESAPLTDWVVPEEQQP